MNGRMIRAAAALFLSAALAACGSSSSNGSPPQNSSPPGAPAGVSATPGNAQVTLSWSAVTGATSYNVYWAATAASATKAGGTKIAGATSPYVHTGLTNGTTYYYAVTAANANGESAESAAVSATPLPAVPAAPTGVSATPGNAQVTLAWSAVTGATSYNAYWATSAAGATKAAGTKITGAMSGTPLTGFTNGTTYYFVVTAVNLGGESAESTVVSAAPATNPAPAAPIGVSATAGNAQVTLTWAAVTGATTYNAYWATSAANATKAAGTKITGAASGTPLTGFTNGTTYYFVVTAVNANGESTESSTVSATPVPPVPAAPSSLAAAAGNAQVTLTWSAATGATSYNVYWSTTTGVTPATGTKIAGVSSGYVHTGLTNGTAYYYVVTAANLGGESVASSPASATPQPPPPTAPTGVTATGGNLQVTVGWSAVTGATSYNVYWSTTTGVTPSNGTKVTGAPNPYVQAGLTNGTPYYYVVTAVNGGGESPASAQVTATPMPGLPGTPTGVTATGGGGQVSVAWSPVPSATSYNVYWSTTAGVTPGTGTKVTGAPNPWVQTGLTSGTAYYYVVTAVNGSGESPASAQVSAVPVPATYSVSGTVTYAGAGTGRIYVGVVPPSCTGGCSAAYGTSIAMPGAFTIRGVPSSLSYQVVAWRDTIGMGAENATFPSGTSTTFPVTGANVSGATVTLADPTPPAPAVPVGLGAVVGNGAGFFSWAEVANANGVEAVTGYDVSWGTDPNASTNGGTASAVAHQFPFLLVGLTNGTGYYFKGRSKVGATTSAWSTVFGPFTPGAGTNDATHFTVSGTISTAATPTGPLYVALGQPGGLPVYVARIASPSASQPYSISGVPAGSYSLYAIYDQNNDGTVGPGDVHDLAGNSAPIFTVAGNTTQNLTLPVVDGVAWVETSHTRGAIDSYSLRLRVDDAMKQAVAAALVSGAGVATPVDVARSSGSFAFQPSIGAFRPTAGSTYGFNVTYADGSTGTLTATVTNVSCPQTLAVAPTPSNLVPTFSWAAPAAPPSGWYGYQFQVNGLSGMWAYPFLGGFMPSTQTSVVYNADGRGPALVSGSPYSWQVTVQDAAGNSCTQVAASAYTP